MNTILSSLSKSMDDKISELGGIDAAIEACDRMYQATFRSEAYPLGERADDLEYELTIEVAVALYSQATGDKLPAFSLDDEDESFACQMMDARGCEEDEYNDCAVAWLNLNYPDFIVDENTLVVDFCNYKGEGEDGVGIYELSKHLPIFASKGDSFWQVN